MLKRASILLGVLLFSLLAFVRLSESGKAAVVSNQPAPSLLSKTTSGNSIYLPLVMKNYTAPNPLGNSLYLPLVMNNYTAPNPLWRFAVGIANRAITSYDQYGVASLRIGWYTDWGVTPNALQPYGTEYIPMVRLKQWKLAPDGVSWTEWCVTCSYVMPYTYTVDTDWTTISQAAIARPGMTWVIGNEIERRDWPNGGRQDEILPEVYAQAYHAIRNAILGADPTAQFAIGGMVETTPLRLQYLDRVWNGYQQYYSQTMPVDVWNIHGFILPEVSGGAGADIPAGISATIGMTYTFDPDNKNFSLLADQVNSLRTWMQAKGEQNKPLIITEYGVNIPDWWGCDTFPITTGCPFAPEQVRDSMMYPSFDYFLNHTDATLGFPADGNRLVQRWDWWSLDYDSGRLVNGAWEQYFNGALFYSGSFAAQGGHPIGTTPLGTYWQQYVKNLPTGSGKPYAPIARTARTVDTKIPSSLGCNQNPGRISSGKCSDATQQVRLLFYAPVASGAWLNQLGGGATPSPISESTLCLPMNK
jgi:hypothetical protein